MQILAQDGTVVQTASVSPSAGGSEWSLREVNGQIRFGTLAEGVYVFRIYAADSAGHTLEFRRLFSVSASQQTSTLYYWSESLTQQAA